MLNTSKVRALIVDDEIDARENLKVHLEDYQQSLMVVGEAENVDEALAFIEANSPDLIFLDIAMPRKSGFELLAQIPNFKGQVIFITSFNEFAEQAFKFLAIGYLIKPIDPDELRPVLEKTIEIINLKKQNQNYEQLLQLLESRNSKNAKIILPSSKGHEVINQSDISYLEAQRNYTTVYCNDRSILVSKNLATIESFLSESSFVRVHRSYIVNLEKIVSIKKEGYVLLEDGSNIQVSKVNLGKITERLQAL